MIPKATIYLVCVLAGCGLMALPKRAPKPIPSVVTTPAVVDTTSPSTEPEQDAEPALVPSLVVEPPVPEATQVSAVAPVCTTCQPAAIKPSNHRTPAVQYYQPARRGIFRFRR